ncbi:MAG: hypothetical protein ACYDC5_13685 [Candidatus Dormibacteria bacterium]
MPLSRSASRGSVRVASRFLLVYSAAWLALGVVLVVGGLNLLNGGTGLLGLVSSDEPGFAPAISSLPIGLGVLVLLTATWGLWAARAMRRLSKGGYISALLLSAGGFVVGVAWATIATTPIPGVITCLANGSLLLGLAVPAAVREEFKGPVAAGRDDAR